MTDVVPPSGEQFEIRYDDQTAVVVAVGGGIRSYDVGGVAVLDGYAEDAMADGARGQLLVPWPNRVGDGTWRWRDRPMQLALTEPAQHHAIHGLARWAAWQPVAREESRVLLEHVIRPQPGYPWTVRATVDHSLSADGLLVRMSMTNLAAEPVPVAAGVHPYLTVGTELVDDAVLHLPASTWLPTDDRQLPTGHAAVDATPYDFRTPRPIGTTRIDYAFTDLDREADGRFRLRLASPDGGRAVTLWLGPAYPFVEVFTGDSLPDESRRRRGLGVEPMTAPPNALVTGDSLVVLEPGETWSGDWGISAD